MAELVSTIIPTFNHEKFLRSAIRSALHQTYQLHEIVVVDDGSGDSTGNLVKKFSSPKLRYLYQGNQGLSAARNTGIGAASGRYLTFLDADDLLFPTAIETLLAATKRMNAGMVAGVAVVMGANGELAHGTIGAPSFEPTDLLMRNPFHVGSIMAAREWVERVEGFDEGLHACEDWDLWLRMAGAGCPIGTIDRVVSLYLNHEDQMSRNPYLMRNASLEVLERVFSDPATPASWRVARTDAYVNAHLRSAARFLRIKGDYEAKEEVRSAITLKPPLMETNGQRIRKVLSSWASDPGIENLHDYKSHAMKAVTAVVKGFQRMQAPQRVQSPKTRRGNLEVGIIVGDETWHFFREIYDHLCRRYKITVFRPVAGLQSRSLVHELRDFLKKQRVAFFEWSSQMLALATQLETDCRIVTRLHRYELFTWADKVDWSRVDAAIFVSSAMLSRFQAKCTALPVRMVVIPPGVSTVRFHPGDPRLKHRIGTLCWLTPRKRVYELILSFAEICRKNPKMRLSIAGGQHTAFPDYYETLVSLVKKLGLSRRVQFVGEPANVAKWYRGVDVFVSNSYSEGIQVALLEAMASGCYCLSHAWPGIEDVLPKDQIYLTDRRLQQQLLAYYAAPPQLRRQLHVQMRQRVSSVFNIELVKRRVASLIGEVVRDQ